VEESGTMSLEVELKYRVEHPQELRQRLAALGCQWEGSCEQTDLYFAHPVRDFRATDEAFRVRRTDTEVCLTYKGPKVDTITKTRREIEIPLHGEYEAAVSMLQALDFRPVLEVRKHRTTGKLLWNQQHLTIAWDEVAQLGTFLEIELIAEEHDLASAQQQILSLAAALELQHSERRGYLQMLLQLDHAQFNAPN
jgi:adenylate cyclase, class 2